MMLWVFVLHLHIKDLEVAKKEIEDDLIKLDDNLHSIPLHHPVVVAIKIVELERRLKDVEKIAQ